MDCSNDVYALSNASEIERRMALLNEPHMTALVSYLEDLEAAARPSIKVPYFDPCDGGVNAKALFLLESPGPKVLGTNYISRNNPDDSARNMSDLLAKAKLARQDTLLWNIVPWYLGRTPTTEDVRQASPHLKSLLPLLPNLQVVVLVGQKAWKGERAVVESGVAPALKTYHPSPKNFNPRPYMRDMVQASFDLASRLVSLSA